MSDWGIFGIGLFVTLLLGGGLWFSLFEMDRIYKKALQKQSQLDTAESDLTRTL